MSIENTHPITSAQSSAIFDRTATTSWRHKAVLLISAAVLSSGIASDSFAQAGKPPAAKDNIVASLTLKDGGFVQFNEVAPGELVVLAQGPAAAPGKSASLSSVAGVSTSELSRLDAVGQYKAFSGGAAPPAALIEAQQRVKAAARKNMPQLLTGSKLQKLDAMAARGIAPMADGSWFQTHYCPTSGYSFNYCLLYRTGGGTTERNASYIQSTIHPYRGNLTHKIEYKDCFLFFCKWVTSITWGVQQGSVGWIWQSGSTRGRRITVFDAEGDGYHRAAFGN
jgi:hypothetical protein